MTQLVSPLIDLFHGSKKLVLDFSKITKNIPEYENFEEIFQSYARNGENPRLPENRQQINNAIIDASGFRYLIGQYREDRSAMLADTPAGKAGRVIHMAIDVFSKDLEPIFSPCDGEIIVSDYEVGFGEYGNYVIIHPEKEDFYIFLGHLSWDRPKIGKVTKGAEIARLGDYPDNENGGWSRHLHIQILTELPGPDLTPNGYSTKEDFAHNSALYPNPLDYFPEWQIQ